MNLTIVAPNGAMGRALIRQITRTDGLSLYSAIGKEGAAYIGEDAGILAGAGKFLGVAITADARTAIRGSEAIIDFSAPAVSIGILSHAVDLQVPLVCGTTGFSREQYLAFSEAASAIPIVLASNTSRAVHLLRRLLAEAARVLPEAEVEIIDMHARTKKDAPSGTALELAQTIAVARNVSVTEHVQFGRKGQQTHKPEEIGMHSLRSGNTASSHTVWFGLPGERLEFTHHATDMTCFAQGALDAARYLYRRAPGLYTMEDVFSVV